MNSSEFICECGKRKSWVTEDKQTEPCPECGRVYVGKYNPNTLSIEAKEVQISIE